MAVVQNPLAGIQYESPEIAAFHGVMERRILLLTAQEIRFRALLEALTGEPWDDSYTDLDQLEIDRLAEKALEKSLGISRVEAAQMVRMHKLKANKQNRTVNGSQTEVALDPAHVEPNSP